MKKIWILFLILILVVISYFLWYNKESKITLITNEQGAFLEMAENLVEELNKHSLKEISDKPIDFYVANFRETKIPEILNNNHYNILYLGSKFSAFDPNIKKFDKIFVSSPEFQNFLTQMNIQSFILPISRKDSKIITDINKNTKWLFIGNNMEIENKLADLGITYDKISSFSIENEKSIIRELPGVVGVIMDNYLETSIKGGTIDFSPLILEMMARKLPIIAPRKLEVRNFNGNFWHYATSSDLESILTTYNTHEFIDRSYLFYHRYYETTSVAKMMISLKYPTNFENTIGFLSDVLYDIGDYWLIRDFQTSSQKLGYETSDFLINSLFPNEGKYNIFMKISNSINIEALQNSDISVIYVLYPVGFEIVDNNIFNGIEEYIDYFKNEFDTATAMAISSKPLVNLFKSKGYKTYYIPQFTNPDRFYPDYNKELKSDILFIGNNYIERKAPRIALKYNLPITIYGKDWKGQAVAEYVDNRILRQYYSSAKINLNDHREGMKKYGFINNRTFDVTASGGFLISDYMPEIEEIYGDSIPMWKTEEELVELLNYYLDPAHEEERLEKAARAREITLKNFTSDIVAEKFDEIIKELKKEKGIE